MIIWVMKIFFLYSSSVYSCHLVLIISASVRSIPFLSFIEPICMKCSLGISNFLEEISSPSHSVVFLHFFKLIAEKGFHISAILWNSAFRCLYLSFSALLFTSLQFTAICKASSDSHFAFSHFFSMVMVLNPVSCTMS